MFEGKYTTMGSRSTLHPRVVKAQLNQHLCMSVTLMKRNTLLKNLFCSRCHARDSGGNQKRI